VLEQTDCWEYKGYFAGIFLKFTGKNCMRQTFHLQVSVTFDTLYFLLPSYLKLEHRKFGAWNLSLNNPTDKNSLAVQEDCQQPAGSVFLSICLTLMLSGVSFTFQLSLSAMNIRPSWGRPKAASFSDDMYVVACIILFILWPCPWASAGGETGITPWKLG